MRATERPQGMPGSKQLSLKATKSGTKCGAYYVYCFTTAPLNPTVTAGWLVVSSRTPPGRFFVPNEAYG
jgi:hypothetical protein